MEQFHKVPVWMNPAKERTEPAVLAYCAGRDVAALPAADELLIPYDLWTNRAHVRMLGQAGILTIDQRDRILESLDRLELRYQQEELHLDPDLEDVHCNIEHWVSSDIGPELGGRIHTARSRNDQIATDMRLFLRAETLSAMHELIALVEGLLELADMHRGVPMPGLTHHQPGGISSLSHWHLCHAQAFMRDIQRLRHAFLLLNECPLGAVASYGTSLPIDREITARLLAFDGVALNSLDAVASRWEMEAETGHALAMQMVHASMVAQDLIVYSTEPFGFVALDEQHTTGSSVMPQKRNPDPCEVIKARAAVVQQLQQSLRAIPTGNVTGYNRDSQWTKYLVLDLWREVGQTAGVLNNILLAAQWDTDRLRAACHRGFLTALDLSEHLAKSYDVPFRKAYTVISTAVTRQRGDGADQLTADAINQALAGEDLDVQLTREEVEQWLDPQTVLAHRTSAGGPGETQVEPQRACLAERVAEAREFNKAQRKRFVEAYNACRADS